MQISLKWIKDYVAVGISPEKLSHKLTMAGHEVEKVLSVNGDTVFEMEITPNRADCLSMLGMAREIAAILKTPRKFPKIKKRARPRQKCNIVIEDQQACLRYVGVLIEGVSVGKSAEKITTRLGSLGMRPINNIVDITNFCLMETGQPLHAFDYDKLAGGKVIVRRARKGEKIVTLDDVERELDPSILVIADEKRPVAIAGIMGGKNTEVTSATKNILLESAYFDPVLIRRASRQLGLSSDSAYRFERGVDDAAVESGSGRAVDLLLESARGTVAKRSDVVVPRGKISKRKITLSPKQVNGRIGSSLTGAECKSILKRLDFYVTAGKNGSLKIEPPSFRQDIKGEEDIIEEISRLIGYDHLPMTFPQIKISPILSSAARTVRQKARNLFLAQGFNEAITYAMISRKSLEQSKQGDLPTVSVSNPLTQDQEIMRPSLLPGLLSIVLTNLNRGQKDLKFFEAGNIYEAKGERGVIGMIMTGLRTTDWRREKKEEADYYDLKGALEQVFDHMGIDEKRIDFQSAQKDFFEEGQGAALLMERKEAGVAGKISQEVLDLWGIKQKNILFAQVDLGQICPFKKPPGKYVAIPEFPSISRDISLSVPTSVTAGDISKVIREAVKKDDQVVLTEIKFIEKYEGAKISKGHRGLVFSLTYRARLKRTLRDEEVTAVHAKVRDTLTKDLGVIHR